jgi:cyanophycin synthetase
MQAARIPVFDPGKIVALQRSSSDQLTLTALLPAIDFVDDKIRQASLKTALVLIRELTRGNHSSSRVADLQNLADEQFVKPVRRMIPGESTIPLLGALYDNRIPFRHLGMGAYQIGWGAHCMLVQRSAFEADSAIGSALSKNKYMATIMMRSAGLPAPDNAIAENAEDAVTRAAALGWPVVVKPQDRDRGEGV